MARENRGATATINEALAMANGLYINVLNSDDEFTVDRIAQCIELIHRSGADWGFAQCEVIDSRSHPLKQTDTRRHPFDRLRSRATSAPRAIEALLEENASISTGNLFVRTEFARALGGFSDHRYNHDWNFCLRAIQHSEPVIVPQVLYRYRLHETNTISENRAAARIEANEIQETFARMSSATDRNPLSMAADEHPLRWALLKAHYTNDGDAFGALARQLPPSKEHD